jgi:hypothetical protein
MAGPAPVGQVTHSTAIVTTGANELASKVHDRMPVILRREDEGLWLDSSEQTPSAVLGCLQPYPEERMEAMPVANLVSSARGQGSELIESLDRERAPRGPGMPRAMGAGMDRPVDRPAPPETPAEGAEGAGGIPVVGADGAPAGRVRAVREGDLLLGRGEGPELPVPLDAIREDLGDALILKAPASGLDPLQPAEPDPGDVGPSL